VLADSSGSTVGLSIGFFIIAYLLVAFAFVGIFKKADQPVWAAFVPIVNYYFLLKVVGRPGWWLILYFIPCVNIIIGIIVLYDLSRSFGHGIGFTIGLIFLSIIFLYILGFGGSEYRGPAAQQPAY
jgi:Family of unknown function (DUF5684)